MAEDNDLGLLNDLNGGDIGSNVGDDETQSEDELELVMESESKDEDDNENFVYLKYFFKNGI